MLARGWRWQIWAEGEVVKASSCILFRTRASPSLLPLMRRVLILLTRPNRRCMRVFVSIWMNLKCQKRHETVSGGMSVVNSFPETRPSGRGTQWRPRFVSLTRGTEASGVGGCPWRPLTLGTPGRTFFPPASAGSPQLLRQWGELFWGDGWYLESPPTYRSVIAAWNVKCLPDGNA